jgi:hypothetical protein
MHDERRRHDVAKKTHSRHNDAERGWLRHDVEELGFDHVAGLGALDEDRPGQRMDETGVDVGQIGGSRTRTDLPVERVPRFQHHLLALGGLQDRCDIGMVAVVAAVRLGGQRLFPVDADCVHGGTPLMNVSD